MRRLAARASALRPVGVALPLPSASTLPELVLVDQSEAGAESDTLVLAPTSLSLSDGWRVTSDTPISRSMSALALPSRRLLHTK